MIKDSISDKYLWHDRYELNTRVLFTILAYGVMSEGIYSETTRNGNSFFHISEPPQNDTRQ
jgi:hypothetical protein